MKTLNLLGGRRWKSKQLAEIEEEESNKFGKIEEEEKKKEAKSKKISVWRRRAAGAPNFVDLAVWEEEEDEWR